MLEMLILLVSAHALADYALQGDFMAKAKNHTTPISGVPFYQPLLAHSAIHAGFVLVITGSVVLAVAEFVIHTITDWVKCDGRISYNIDQAIHIACKVLWAMIATQTI